MSFLVRHFWLGDRRRREERRWLRRRAERAGLHVYRGNLAWEHLDFYVRAARRGIPGIPDARCFTLQSVIRDLAGTPGDVAECGVRFGKSAAFLLEADRADRNYHLFDSFEGVSQPTEEDLISSNRFRWRKHELAAPQEIAQANLKDFENVRVYKGWIPERFGEVTDRSFALLHVDVDLYEPTRDALTFFWPRLAPGGAVICDDYGARGCPGARRAMDEFFKDKPVRFLELPTAQAVVLKRDW